MIIFRHPAFARAATFWRKPKLADKLIILGHTPGANHLTNSMTYSIFVWIKTTEHSMF
jgi:hypothetical protein